MPLGGLSTSLQKENVRKTGIVWISCEHSRDYLSGG